MTIQNDIQSNGFLSKEEQTFVNIIFTGFLYYKNSTAFMKKFDLTEPQYNVLRILRGKHPTKMLGSDIQSRMLHTNSNSTRLINKLVEKGLVKRTQDDFDKRQMLHRITLRGRTLLSEMDSLLIDFCSESVPLSAEKMDLLNALLDELRSFSEQ